MLRIDTVIKAILILLLSPLFASHAHGAGCDSATIQSKLQLFKNGSCLRGANMYQQEKYATVSEVWNPVIHQQDLIDLRQQGANLVNYSIPGPYDVRTYQRRDDFFRKLDELVDYAQSADLFVILSFRTAPGRGEGNITGTEGGFGNTELYTNSTAQNAFASMWREVAARYSTRKHVVGYDLLVEPNGVSLSSWRAIAQNTVNAIRSVDPSTPILISPPDWGVVSSLSSWTPLSGTNLLYTVHQYEPFNYTHNNATANWSAVLDSMYSQVSSWMTKYGQTIVVNEFGVANKVTDAHLFMQKQIQLLEQRQLNYATWIWEVEYDPNYTYEAFDFKEYANLFNVIRSAWQKNIVFPSSLGLSTNPTPAPSPSPQPTPISSPAPTPTPAPQPTSIPCGTPSNMSAISGKPTLYLYRECASGNFIVQAYGSVSKTQHSFSGRISTQSPASLQLVSRLSLESKDRVSLTSNQAIDFSLYVSGTGHDGFSFSASSATASCLKTTLPIGGQILVGPNRTAIANSSSGISLATLQSCTTASPSPSPSPSASPAPAPTPSPTPIPMAQNIPMTSTEWQTEYTGYGYVNYQSDGSVEFAPKAAISPDVTHATLLLSRRHISAPVRNFRMTVVATTEQQLRTPTPNAWETFWVMFNYANDSNGKKITNYFTMKPNGIELGRAYDELGQQFLSTFSSPQLVVGRANTFVIEKIGQKLKVSVDGVLVMSYDGTTGPYPMYDHPGTIGLYSEDARVRVNSVSVEPLP